MVVSKTRAESDLEPYRTRIARCVTDGIRDFLAQQAPNLAFMRRGTQANLVRDYIVRNVRREFPDGEDGVIHRDRRGLYLLTIGNRYALRFKKLNPRFRTSNHPTQLTLDFLLQRPLQLFPELDEVAHLNVGYQPGATLANSTVWITCPNGDVLDWMFSISEGDEPEWMTDRRRPDVPAPTRGGVGVRPRKTPKVALDGSSG